MWKPQHEPRVASWVQDGFEVIEAAMAPEGWEPPADDQDEDGDGEDTADPEAEVTASDTDPGAGEEEEGGDPGETQELDETPELPRDRALELLYDEYEAESDAEYALEELLNRGWLYEVEGNLRVTEAEW